ncbi:uncharacterized protein LOC18436427 isoform X2 [Amborella trichopoda]|uniref:uncharacterized protein LOC18436427 isoform X2 n=1 Tax=Amborella trichopoda TaxID=13333 RepID=UPI0009BDA67E|nr:uncharacterized protein LOC18436427 isoform X2 [Amborella trichopoda]|eukprot:XP_020524273.1 uncharacterized protein LOC18436427 isoform X2 [Amborella trichopoda]
MASLSLFNRSGAPMAISAFSYIASASYSNRNHKLRCWRSSFSFSPPSRPSSRCHGKIRAHKHGKVSSRSNGVTVLSSAFFRGKIRIRGYCMLSTSPNGVAVISSNENYGNKEVISVTPQLYEYILANVREPEILRELREETAGMQGSQMQVSPDQAQLLAMLVQILGAQRCIEIGVYTGYSSLAIALVLPESGRLVACDRDAKCLEVAKRYYKRAGVSHKVEVKHALAINVLESLIETEEPGCFDFAFVDAEKRMYKEYYELLLQLVRPGGVIVIDNVLWHGRVADPLVNDKKTMSIRDFNRSIFEDKRVSICVIRVQLSCIKLLTYDPCVLGSCPFSSCYSRATSGEFVDYQTIGSSRYVMYSARSGNAARI